MRGVTGMTSYADMIYEIDVALGKLVDALTQRGLADNTLIVFTSDNGGYSGANWRFDHDAVGGLRGSKSRIWEGGHRVPMVVKWGDGSPAGSMIPPNTTSNQLIGTHDLMATVAALIGETLPEEQARDSFNFLPVFLGTIGDESPVRDHLIMEADKLDGVPVARPGTLHFAYREGPWKLVFDPDQNVMGLYNLATDLAETLDLKDDPNEADRIESMVMNFQRLHAAARTAPLSSVQCGDFDGNGIVNTLDAQLIQRCVIGEIACAMRCDATGDGVCNTADARLVQRYAVGLLSKDALSCGARS